MHQVVMFISIICVYGTLTGKARFLDSKILRSALTTVQWRNIPKLSQIAFYQWLIGYDVMSHPLDHLCDQGRDSFWSQHGTSSVSHEVYQYPSLRMSCPTHLPAVRELVQSQNFDCTDYSVFDTSMLYTALIYRGKYLILFYHLQSQFSR